MGSLIATLFKEHANINDFRGSVLALDGTFSFTREDMLEIGQAYCERYPESYSKRNPQQVQIGYTMARICIVEKALAGLSAPCKHILREIFYSLNAIEEHICNLIEAHGHPCVCDDYQKILRSIGESAELIDSLPKGMIKEKFVGGLSVIYNVMYLIKSCIDKFGGKG